MLLESVSLVTAERYPLLKCVVGRVGLILSISFTAFSASSYPPC